MFANPIEGTLVAMRRGDLTDKQWALLGPILPPHKPKTGRPNKDHRRIVNGLLWINRTGAPWCAIYPSAMARGGRWRAASTAGAKQAFGTGCCECYAGELLPQLASL